MIVEQMASHISRKNVVVNVHAFDRMKLEIAGRGTLEIIDMGYNEGSRILSMGFSLTEGEELGRVYLPIWYTAKMLAFYVDTLVACAKRRDKLGKLIKMLDGYNPQERRKLALERLVDMSYIEGYVGRADETSRDTILSWTDENLPWGAPIIEITPVDDYFLKVAVVTPQDRRMFRIDYAYGLDDIVAYITTARTVLEQFDMQFADIAF